jgi:hypothetical protein
MPKGSHQKFVVGVVIMTVWGTVLFTMLVLAALLSSQSGIGSRDRARVVVGELNGSAGLQRQLAPIP